MQVLFPYVDLGSTFYVSLCTVYRTRMEFNGSRGVCTYSVQRGSRRVKIRVTPTTTCNCIHPWDFISFISSFFFLLFFGFRMSVWWGGGSKRVLKCRKMQVESGCRQQNGLRFSVGDSPFSVWLYFFFSLKSNRVGGFGCPGTWDLWEKEKKRFFLFFFKKSSDRFLSLASIISYFFFFYRWLRSYCCATCDCKLYRHKLFVENYIESWLVPCRIAKQMHSCVQIAVDFFSSASIDKKGISRTLRYGHLDFWLDHRVYLI